MGTRPRAGFSKSGSALHLVAPMRTNGETPTCGLMYGKWKERRIDAQCNLCIAKDSILMICSLKYTLIVRSERFIGNISLLLNVLKIRFQFHHPIRLFI